MSFTVVQTRKSSTAKPEISVVPTSWIENGTLRYPENRIVSMAKDSSSKPDATWKSTECKVLATSIRTFEEADGMISDYQNRSDSEGSMEISMATRGRPVANRSGVFTSNTFNLAPPHSIVEAPAGQTPFDVSQYYLNDDSSTLLSVPRAVESHQLEDNQTTIVNTHQDADSLVTMVGY